MSWTTAKNMTNFARNALLASWKLHNHMTRFGKKKNRALIHFACSYDFRTKPIHRSVRTGA